MEPKPTVVQLYQNALKERKAEERAESASFALMGTFLGLNLDNLTQPEIYGSDIDFIPLAMAGVAVIMDLVHTQRAKKSYLAYRVLAETEGHLANQRLDQADQLLILSGQKNRQISFVNMLARISEGAAIGIAAENVVYERSINDVPFMLSTAVSVGFESVKFTLVRQRDKLIQTARDMYSKAGKKLAADICSLTLKQ